MWTSENFPGADKVPWQLLIRARYVDEIDAIVAHTVVQSLTPLLAKERARNLAEGAASAVKGNGSKRVEVTPDRRQSAMHAFVEWDGEICPRWWPWPWPWPPGTRFDSFDDPALRLAVGPVHALVRGAGSDELGQVLEGAIGGWAVQ